MGDQIAKKSKKEDHDGPISLTCANMVLYRSPVQTDLHTSYLSFSQVHCSKIFV